MNAALKTKIPPILFAFAGLMFLVPVVGQIANEEQVEGKYFVVAVACLIIAAAFFARSRR